MVRRSERHRSVVLRNQGNELSCLSLLLKSFIR